MHTSQLTVLPYSDTQEESHHIAQLFSVQLLNISVRSHLGQVPVADLATKSIHIDQKSHHRSGHKQSDSTPIMYAITKPLKYSNRIINTLQYNNFVLLLHLLNKCISKISNDSLNISRFLENKFNVRLAYSTGKPEKKTDRNFWF